MVRLKDIFFRYPNSAFSLEFAEMSFPDRTKNAVIGPSGFGKTTLLNLISGIAVPEKGEITVFGKKVNKMTDSERRAFRLTQVGFVFQDFKLLEYLNVADNILLPYRINKALVYDKKVKGRLNELVLLLGIHPKLSSFPAKLSQGERQRVAVCRALIHNPALILADEPTGNLDPANKDIIMNILFDYVSEKKSGLIAVTHDHELLIGFDQVTDVKNYRKE
jgi:putative ABC transport system ATP-binding protein